MSGLSWAEIDARLMSEDPGDRADRKAHGFGYDDDWQDDTLLCRNGCGLSYPEIVAGKIRGCRASGTAGRGTTGRNEAVTLEDAQEGKRYKVTWDDCSVQDSFEATVTSMNYVPDPPEPEPFLDSATFDNGVTVSGSYGYVLEDAPVADSAGPVSYAFPRTPPERPPPRCKS